MPLERDIRTIRVLFSDLHGVARGKDVPAERFDEAAREGLWLCAAVMATDLRNTPVLGAEEGYPDLRVVPDPETLVVLPWEPGVAACLGDVRPLQGGAAVADPRGAVRRAIDALTAAGLAATVGPELEFFLLGAGPPTRGGVRPRDERASMVYTVGPHSDPGGVVRRLSEQLAQAGLGSIAATHEVMAGQYEINLAADEPLTAADRAFRLRAAVKDVAALSGLGATFMGKPFNDQGGSGFHLHVSLRRDGANAFADPSDPDGASALLRSFVGGVLHHAPAAMAVLNPTVNAYRRLMPDSLAPTRATWGWDNRSALVRVPPERGENTRVEVRVGDASANPYLAIAVVLQAGLDGIRGQIAPPAPTAGNAYRAAGGTPLPGCLEDALDALERDPVVSAALGPAILRPFVAVKRHEAARHRAWVSDWELDEYVRLL